MSNTTKSGRGRRRQSRITEISPASGQPQSSPVHESTDLAVASSPPGAVFNTAPAASAAAIPLTDPPVKHHKKPKLLRDSFKFPPEEYSVFEELKRRCLAAGREVKKSELVRAGLLALKNLPDAKLFEVLGKLKKLKTGRPPKT